MDAYNLHYLALSGTVGCSNRSSHRLYFCLSSSDFDFEIDFGRHADFNQNGII
jgi:hypothetical protein